MRRGWLAGWMLLLAAGVALSCGSRTAVLGDVGADSGTSSGGSSGGSSGIAAPDSGACSAGQALCGGACVDEQTDPAHCGGCGIVCAGTCALGRCLVTLASQVSASSIAVDDTAVYWTTMNGTVMKVPVGGGAAGTLASGQDQPAAVVVDGTSVYWLTSDAFDDSAITKVPRTGGATPVTLITYGNEFSPTPGLAVDTAWVYWTDFVSGNPVPGQLAGARVRRMPSSGGPAQTLVEGLSLAPTGLAVDATSVYWAGSPGSPTNFTNVLLKVPLQGGTPATLATYQSWASAMVAALPLPVVAGQTARDVYWIASPPMPNSATQPPTNLLSAPATGGSPSTLAISANSVALDSTTLYWTTDGSVMSAPLTGGTPVTLAAVGGGEIAVDATSVYWLAEPSAGPMGTNAILKLTPK